MKYRWLHISDLHSICKGIRTSIMKDALIDEIDYINKQSPFSFVLITGDISDKNIGYDEAKILIHKIIEVIGLSTDKVFMVPGNHDLNRSIPDDRELKVKSGWELDILDDKESSLITSLLPGQHDFFKSYEDILGREYPKDKVHFSYDLDENISIIHLNTAWMCYDSNNESGKLHIGLNRVNQCLSDNSLQSKPIKIAIGHHRISDFNKTVENYLKSLFKSKDIDLYLGGHCHESSVIYDPSINTEFCSCRQARAEDVNFPAGFIVGDINTDNDQSSFQFYGWDGYLAKWTYDYTVNPAKHGKYYLRGEKFTKVPIVNRNVIIDLKLFGIPIDYEAIMSQFNIRNSAIYRASIRDFRPKSQEDWNACLKDLRSIYYQIVKDANECIHIFPISFIPLLVSFGYLIQNDNPNIKIYQYVENNGKWVYDDHEDDFPIITTYEKNGSNKLVLSLSISSEVEKQDIEDILGIDYDLIKVAIEDPALSKLNYYKDVLKVKLAIKSELDKLVRNYKEVHLFLAAPAGLCIEVGRIIRENMYPDTFIYNFVRTDNPKYTRVFNLKDVRNL